MRNKPTVLIVDDEKHLRRLFERVISNSNFEVLDCAFDGNNAIDLFIKLKPDLVLLDVNMPFKSGVEVLREFQATDQKSCIIMLTSIADLETVKLCTELGASGYVRKDEPLNSIISIIEQTWNHWSSN